MENPRGRRKNLIDELQLKVHFLRASKVMEIAEEEVRSLGVLVAIKQIFNWVVKECWHD